MRIYGVIAEYNPFHNGHAYQLEQMRAHGATHIAAVMSGNFVQRGSLAICNKFARAEMAVANGADLVLELPATSALASAEIFAYGGVTLLDALGCVDTLSFGCEDTQPDSFYQLANLLGHPDINQKIKDTLASGISYPAARQAAVAQTAGDELASLLNKPNNILAVEYCKALNRRGCTINIHPIQRIGSEHDQESAHAFIASASTLRRMLLLEQSDTQPYIPHTAYAILEHELSARRAPCRLEKLETAILAALRMIRPEGFAQLPDVSEGLEYRLYAAARAATNLQEFYALVKTKRYTLARIRRITLYAFLTITRKDLLVPPAYLRVLAVNERGFEILRRARITAKCPIIMRAADIVKQPKHMQANFYKECTWDDLFALSMPTIAPCGASMSTGVRILKTSIKKPLEG